MLKSTCTAILKLFGWSLDLRLPIEPKVIVVGYPHTSNWDFVLTMLAMPAMNYRFNWVAKHSMFNNPLGETFKRMGGVPLNRKKSQGFVEHVIDIFNERERFALAIAPEGTRSYKPRWKTGFYHIAVGAGIPLSLGYIDYKTKTLGIGKTFMPSGNIEDDFKIISDFYAEMVGKRPHLQGPIAYD